MRTVKFKSSEVGPIPVEWEVKRLGVLADIQLGKMVDEEKNVGVPKYYLSNRDVHWGSIDVADLHQVRMTDDDLHKYDLRDGDLLVCEGGEVGRAAIWHAPITDCYFQKTLHRVRVGSRSTLYVPFLQSLLQRYAKVGMFDAYVAKTSIAHLPKDKFEQLPIFCPPRAEQEKIAEALSDVDELLAAMTMLIEKKRAIKQGVMQQLLTGKKRLAGFTGPWVEKRLGDCGNFIAGNGFPLRCQGGTSGDFPFFKVSDFSNVGNESTLKTANNYISKKILDELKCNVVPSGAIVFAKIGAAIALERKRIVRQDSCIDNNMMAFVVNESNSNEYLVEVLRQMRFAQLSESTALPALNVGALRNVSVYIPPTIAEQKAIAAVLSDMDAEIAVLEAKRAKYESVKQGMMQELLTGRVRLGDRSTERA